MERNMKNAAVQNDLAQLAQLFNQQKLSECETLARQITKKHPKQGFAWKVLGAVLQKLERVDESLFAKKKAVELLPQDAEAYNNLASALASVNHHDEAVKHYRKAIHLNVNYIEAHYNLGISLEKLNNLTEAEACYRQAVKLNPSHPNAHTNLALLLLRNGEFSEGWAEYQWSYHPQNTTPNQPKEPNVSATRWQGESLKEKIILIYSEQGLGDMIQFVRYSELLKSRGATVWVLANRALTTLFETVPWIDRVLTEGEQYALSYDFWVFPFSLPFLLQTTLDSIPSTFPYIFANQEKSLWWRNWLDERAPSGHRRVGLVWAGNPKHPNDAKRSIPLEQFSILKELENVSWVSLQLGEKARADIERSDLNIIDASAFIFDLSDTAALLANLDLLITVDSAPAHLAGALNVPVWILIAQVPDWRWLLTRNDSVWYDSCILFRQSQHCNWASILQDIKMSLNVLNMTNENKMNQIISIEPAENVLVELAQLFNQNHTETCEKLALELVEQFPKHGFAWKVMGALLQKQGRTEESLSAKRKAAELIPNDAEVHSNLASAEMLKGLFEEAELSCRRALTLNPLLVSAHNNLGLILQKLGQHSEAEACFRKVLDIGQKSSENFCNLGNALQAQDKFTEAEENYQQALLLNADYLDAHNNLGVIFKKSGKLSQSEQSYRRVVELNPNDFDSHNNLGIILQEMDKLSDAQAAYQRALELAPQNANIHCNLGNIFLAKHQHQDAMQAYRNALISMPDNAYALSQCVYIDRMLCNWHSINEDNTKLLTYIEKKVASVLVPFGILATPIANPQHQKKSAELHADFRYKSKLEHLPYVRENTYGHTKLRIGYLSADMHSHATVRLLAGVLENRNTQAFITHIYSYGPNKADEGRSRMEAACEHFHEVSWLSDEAIAKQIVADEIDILVDLKGYTQDGRLGITALRPAPVIVSWLGYPGTLGHPRLADYIIGDPTVTPLEHATDFSETLALMPHCYQPNDDQRKLGIPPSRKDVGLPETGFVFCSFNQPYKITPETFSVWCRLLVAVPDSVLWIMALFPDTQANLKAEVAKFDIDPNRLIFAPPMLLTSHLGRLQLADLAIDTFPYTSHTTASDALWAGVPLVTKTGETFASRVAASILNTMDLAELVTTNDEDYFNVALSLAQNAEKLAAIKQKITAQKQISPLFDTSKFARDLNRLYQSIWEQELKGDRKPILLQPEEVNPLAQIDTPANDFLTLSTAIESSSAKESTSEINHVHLSPLLALLKPERLTHVVDIGANPIDGDPPYKSMLSEKLCFVTGFEPQQSALAELLSKKTANERYLPYAVGDGQSHTLKVCRASGLTSLFEPDLSTLDLFDALKPLAEVTQRIEMTTRKLDDVTEIENIDFLKIDIQGAELSVFQHGIKKLAQTVAIQVEVSFVTLYENQPTLGDIDIELRRQGFIPHCFAAVKKWVIAPCILNNNPRQPLNQLLEADIVYVRDFSKPELMSDEQLKQLAIVAHYCYGSHDLALRCIMNLEKRKTLALGSQTQYLKII